MSGLKKDMGTIQRAIQMLAGTYDKDKLDFELANIISVDTQNWQCKAQLISGTKQTIYSNVQLTSEVASNGFVQVPKVGSNVILAITWRNEVYVFMCSEVDALVFHQANNDDNKTFEEFVICCNSDLNLPLGIQLTDGGGNGIVINSGSATNISNSQGNNGVVISSGSGDVSNDSNGIVITNSDNPPSNSSGGLLITCSGTMQLNDGSYDGLVKVADLTTKLNNLENKVNDLVNAWSSFATVYAPGSPSSTGLPATVTNVTGTLTTTQQSDIENADIKHGKSVS
jgi:hypothetical protein